MRRNQRYIVYSVISLLLFICLFLLLAVEWAGLIRPWLYAAGVMLLFTVSIGLLFHYERRRRRELRRYAEQTRLRQEQYQIVARQCGRNVARYEVDTRTLYRENIITDGFGGPDSIQNVPESILAAGVVADGSADAFCALFTRIHAGESPITEDYLMIRADGTPCWYRHAATTLFSDDGTPRAAIISYYDCTNDKKREQAYEAWQQELNSLPENMALLHQWNLSQNYCEREDELETNFLRSIPTFDGRIRAYAETRVHEEDRPAYTAFMNRERLIGAFHNGHSRSTMEYREQKDDGAYRWVKLTVQLTAYPDSADVRAYLILSDIDEQKQSELALIARAQSDPLTGALNRDAFSRRVNELMESHAHASHVLMVIDIDDFNTLNRAQGREIGNELLKGLAKTLRGLLRASDIIGRIGGDEFMLCLVDMPFYAAAGKKAQSIQQALNKLREDKTPVTLSIGISAYPQDGNAYDTLYQKACAALYYVKRTGKNNFAFYENGMEQPENVIAKINAAELEPQEQPKKHVLLAFSAEDEAASIDQMLSDAYIVLISNTGQETLRLIRRYQNELSAVVLDADAAFSPNVLQEYAGERRLCNPPLLAVTSNADGTRPLALIQAGASVVLEKPVARELLLARLELIITAAEWMQKQIQSGYHRLQGDEETRYREVRRATGTLVFVFDVETQAYVPDPQAERYIAARFDGRSLLDIIASDGFISRADMDEGMLQAQRVSSGEMKKAQVDVRMKTPAGVWRWFRLQIVRTEHTGELTQKLLIIINDIDEKVEAREKLRYRAERDLLTGLYNAETFYEKAEQKILQDVPGAYVFSCFDVDNFKVINDQYGKDEGDRVLKALAALVEKELTELGGLCCRVFADNFALLYPNTPEHAEAMERLWERAVEEVLYQAHLSISVGRYVVDDLSLAADAMYDRALIAKSSVKGRYDTHLAYYQDGMRQQILREQEITGEMRRALEEEHFEVWLQPQYNLSSGALIGAEALVRWRHPEKGIISPGVFIPIFERNGFVYTLDKYVWERACQFIRRWQPEKDAALPVSVNVSRMDVFQEDFYVTLTGLVERYGISADMLRLEITESAFSQSTVQIVEMVDRLRAYGFTIEIDDFGSGYSSLNTLKDVAADVLKLDMRFLETNANTQRGGNIVASVVRMAKWLGMPVIAEGVETLEQAEYLKSIGCAYVQGYLYAKPMPIPEYEALLVNSVAEQRMMSLETVENLDRNTFWDPKSMDTLIFNHYVGAAGVLEYYDGHIELLRVNAKYAKAFGVQDMGEADILGVDFHSFMDDVNIKKVTDVIEYAIASHDEATVEFDIRVERAAEPIQHMRAVVRSIASSADRHLIYCSIENVTAQRMAQQRLKETTLRLQSVMRSLACGVCAYSNIQDGMGSIVFANAKYFELYGYTREEYLETMQNSEQLVLPEDRETLRNLVTMVYTQNASVTHEFRARKKDGSVIWLRGSMCTGNIGEGERVLIVVTTDITQERAAQRRLEEMLDHIPGGMGIYEIEDGQICLRYLNNGYYEMIGRSRAFSEQYDGYETLKAVHPDDREHMAARYLSSAEKNSPVDLSFRVIKDNGEYVKINAKVRAFAREGGKCICYAAYTLAEPPETPNANAK